MEQLIMQRDVKEDDLFKFRSPRGSGRSRVGASAWLGMSIPSDCRHGHAALHGATLANGGHPTP